VAWLSSTQTWASKLVHFSPNAQISPASALRAAAIYLSCASTDHQVDPGQCQPRHPAFPIQSSGPSIRWWPLPMAGGDFAIRIDDEQRLTGSTSSSSPHSGPQVAKRGPPLTATIRRNVDRLDRSTFKGPGRSHFPSVRSPVDSVVRAQRQT